MILKWLYSNKQSKVKGGYFIAPIIFGVFVFAAVYFLYFYLTPNFPLEYVVNAAGLEVPAVKHIQTPNPLKAVYITSYTAGSKKNRDAIVGMIESTELNSIVIDIKDYTGRVAFKVTDPNLAKVGSVSDKMPDIKNFIDELHQKGIYVIGRIAVFQDPYFVKYRPDLAVKKDSDKTAIWKDYKGISWIDADAPEFWDYILAISKEAYSTYGFDELNYDYIRFPSDGEMRDIYYPFSNGKTKIDVMREFFSYLSHNLKSSGAVLSADLFGMTATNKDDLNIGQLLENTLPYFDFVAPMVYPSHYPATFLGYSNPADYPYQVIKYSLDRAYARASTTPQKIRPWLQDFDYKAVYTADMVKLEMKATYDAGFNSWMLWDPSNTYTKGALLLKETDNMQPTNNNQTATTTTLKIN